MLRICFVRIKNNGQNFQVQLLVQDYQIQHVPVSINPNVAVPEDLVQVQAYLRWERKGRQTYTPEQEKASVFTISIQTIFFIVPKLDFCMNVVTYISHLKLEHV